MGVMRNLMPNQHRSQYPPIGKIIDYLTTRKIFIEMSKNRSDTRCFFGRLKWKPATGRAISRATSKRTTTCDLRPIAGRMLRDSKTNNNLRPAISRRSHVAGRRSRDILSVGIRIRNTRANIPSINVVDPS
ncbi:hypothetical protein YC2023_078512 [Brassica napus]